MKRKLLILMWIISPLWISAQIDEFPSRSFKVEPLNLGGTLNSDLSEFEMPSISALEKDKPFIEQPITLDLPYTDDIIKPAFYLELSVGINFSNFRDFATSPLVYNGSPKYFSIAYQKYAAKFEMNLGLSSSLGKYRSVVGDNVAISNVMTFSAFYSRLYNIEKWSNEKWFFRAGGLLNSTYNYRLNSALQNNAVGIEWITTLYGSGRVQRDVSRMKEKHKKFLFIKYTLKPRTKRLSLRYDLGLMNNTFRNGYVYAGQSSVLNDPKLFDDYQFKFFSGFRTGAALEYLIYLKNRNAVKFSYLWDAYYTGGDLDRFEMASHVLKFSLMFNTK